jgi:hypothetical protein
MRCPTRATNASKVALLAYYASKATLLAYGAGGVA